MDGYDALADPAHDRHGHAVAERLVTGTIGGGLAAIVNQGVIIGEPLQALTLAWRQPSHGHLLHDSVELLATFGGGEASMHRTFSKLPTLIRADCDGIVPRAAQR